MKTIIFSIPHGYFVRSLLRTGILKNLVAHKDIRIVILSPVYNDPSFVNEFSIDSRISFVQQYDVRSDIYSLEKLLWKICLRYEKLPRLFLLLMRLNYCLYILFSKRLYDDLFRLYKPSLVITASPGFIAKKDIPVIREAINKRIPTLYIVHSWDNLTTKGIMPTRPKKMAVWNEMMKEEAIKIHYYRPQDIYIVGSLGFDFYFNKDIFLYQDEFFNHLGMDRNRRLITLTTAAPGIADHTFLIEILSKAIEQNRFITPVQLLCRFHPKEPEGTYDRFKGRSHIFFDHPRRYREKLGWDPDNQEKIHLANIIKHSDVMINIASTITIEAAILDRPVINVGFTTIDHEHFRTRILESFYKGHFQHILQRKGSRFVQNEEELIENINMYLKDPSIDREGRLQLAQDLCYRLDGQAHKRVADLILELVK